MRGLWRLRRWFRGLSPRALVLVYHSIYDSPSKRVCVSPRHFAEHMEHLRKRFRPISLGAALGGRFRHAVVVTFDDGYEDNLSRALPILERYEIPATFFVASGQLGFGREFWWDRLHRLLLGPGPYPEELRLPVGPASHAWATASAEDRAKACEALQGLLKALRAEQVERALAAVASWAGTGASLDLRERPMTHAELVRLAGSRIAEIGAHTRSHAYLATLSLEEQRNEIAGSRSDLEEWLGRRVESFAYPFGTADAFTPASAELVRESGFRIGCTGVGGQLTAETSPFLVPRYFVRDWDGDLFARNLSWWND